MIILTMDTDTHQGFGTTFTELVKPHANLTSYYFFNDVFSPDECKLIIETFDNAKMETGTVFTNATEISPDRVSNINWVPFNNTTGWIYDRIVKHMRIANDNMFHFDVTSLHDRIQFTKYDGSVHGKYKKHMDVGSDNINGCRKLSASIQLSDPSTYDGGKLIIRDYEAVPKEVGTMCVFPSFLEHEVKPVLFGTRYSLVLWLYGPQFR